MTALATRAIWTLALIFCLALPTTASAISIIGEQVDLTWNFGNGSGTLSTTVGAGSEFVLDGAPGFNVFATLDFTADTLTLTHSRGTGLGPGLPFVDDDFLTFTFPNLSPTAFSSVTLTADPYVTWFSGLASTGNSISLTQLTTGVGVPVGTGLKVWSIVPEPSTAMLIVIGLAGIGVSGRQRG